MTNFFTLENTAGFTAAELELMNAAAQVFVNKGYEIYSACDAVNNNWMESGNTIETLTAFPPSSSRRCETIAR